MIKAIIIDDEAFCIEALVQDLGMYCPQVQLLATCHSAKEGMLAIQKHMPDLVFLDVEMPWMNGFEMLEALGKNIDFQIIFTTAYSQFAKQAFRVSAVDYLMKPIDDTELIEAVSKVEKMMQLGRPNANIANLIENVLQPIQQQKIAVPNKDGYDFILIEKILYCKAEGQYTFIHLADKRLLLSKPLGETEQLLPESLFERIHHSLLVKIAQITQMRKGDANTVIMSNGEELPVSKSKKEKLLARMGVR